MLRSKKTQGIVSLMVVLTLALLLVPFHSASATGTTLSIGIGDTPPGEAAESVLEGTFIVNVNIVEPVTALDSYQFNLSYDATICQVSDVTVGQIGGKTVPIDGWFWYAPDALSSILTIGVLGNLPGLLGTTGTGYLAQVHFNVLGTVGQSSALTLSNVGLFDNTANLITPLTINNGSVSIVTSHLQITTLSPLISCEVGVPYSQTLSATGGTSPYTWSIQAGTLPDGLSLSETTGNITGIPTTAGGPTIISFMVTDNAGDTATKDLPITIVPAITIVSNSPLPVGEVRVSYSHTLAASGGMLPYIWSVQSGTLPSELTLSPTSGTIVGTPTAAAGPVVITFEVTDNLGGTATKELSITIIPGPTITTNSPLPDGTVGIPYLQTLAVSDGLAPYTWSIDAGTLPEGLSLNETTGEISGTPTAAISQTILTIMVTDSLGGSDTEDISITINTTTVSISAPAKVAPGGEFVAIVNITQVANLDSYQFEVNYDPTVLQITDVTSGLINSTTMPIDMWAFIPEGIQGQIGVLGNLSGANGISGFGYLAEIHFQVVGLQGENGAMTFSNGQLFDNMGDEITPVIWVNGTIDIVRPGDANGDGVINMGDVTKIERIILGYDAPTPGADANGDGVINMADVTKIERIILKLDT